MAIWNRLMLWSVALALAAGAAAAAAEAPGSTHYYFRHVVLAPSAAKAAAFPVSAGSPKILVDELPPLANKEFADFIVDYIGREITDASLAELIADVTKFLRGHGQDRVDVTTPPQNVANGDVRLVVVLGAYELKRLVLGGQFDHTRDLRLGPSAGQIVIDQLPAAVQQQSFAVALAPYFGQPITDESLEGLIGAIDGYVRSQGQTLAKTTLPPQDIRTGELRLVLSLGKYPLKRVYIAPSAAEAARLKAANPEEQIVAPDAAYFHTLAFARVLAPYFGQPIDKQMVDKIRLDIASYIKTQDRVVSGIPTPEIDLDKGEVRLVVGIEHYSQIHFKGNRWFSDRLLARQLRVKPGDEVRVSQLDAALNQLNQNPYRHAEVLLDTVNKDPGVADANFVVQEKAPYRVSGSYDDTGNAVLGDNRYTVSVQAGNLWGLDHQLSYQYTTTDVSHAFHSNVLTYRAPMPSNNYIQFTSAFTGYRADFGAGFFHLKGRAFQDDLRYVIPVLHQYWSIEYSIGLDYKQNYLDETFQGIVPVADNAQDVAQANTGITWLEHDKTGNSALSVSGNFSPGGLNSRNTSKAYQGNTALDPTTGQPIGGPEAEARYVYGTVFAQRLTTLPADFQWLVRGQAQLSSARLVSTERFSIGGAATVRGYDERIMSGDEGWAFTTEVRSPAWHQHIPLSPQRYTPLETRFLAFYDEGHAYYRHQRVDDFPLSQLESAGLGLRSNWASNFSISVDYGWQIRSTGPGPFAQPNHGRWHLQGAISY